MLFQEAQNPILCHALSTCIERDSLGFLWGESQKLNKERGGAMNGKVKEKLDVSHTAIGFPWGFTQSRPNSHSVTFVIPD